MVNQDYEKSYLYIWESEAANKVFKTEFAAEFEALDKQCEKLTENEVLVGRFEVV